MSSDQSAATDEWKHAIEAVLEGDGLNLAVQPIVDLARGLTSGYEVLSRFTGPPQATPDIWFAHAERLGLGPALDALVIRRALTLRDDLAPEQFLSINLDPAHLWDERVTSALMSAGNLKRIVVELTEHTIIDDWQGIAVHLQRLRDAGAKIAIDDAGSGYAGLQWLMSLSPDLIKVDRALIDGIDCDETKIALVGMLGSFADRIDAWVLAEGMERMAELDAVLRLGVPLGQGYLLARPSLERWPDVVPEVAEHLQMRAKDLELGESLALLVETTTTRLGTDTPTTSPATPVVVVDADGHPVCLDLPGNDGCPILAVRASETIADAVTRAMTRPTETRWTPMVCVTESRNVVGIVRMERLVEHLLSRSGGGATPEEIDQ